MDEDLRDAVILAMLDNPQHAADIADFIADPDNTEALQVDSELDR